LKEESKTRAQISKYFCEKYELSYDAFDTKKIDAAPCSVSLVDKIC